MPSWDKVPRRKDPDYVLCEGNQAFKVITINEHDFEDCCVLRGIDVHGIEVTNYWSTFRAITKQEYERRVAEANGED